LTIASGKREDVYHVAPSLASQSTGTSGGNFENLVVGTGTATAHVTDTTTNATVDLSASTVSEGAVANYVFTATLSNASHGVTTKIGRASCRERAEGAAIGVPSSESGNGE